MRRIWECGKDFIKDGLVYLGILFAMVLIDLAFSPAIGNVDISRIILKILEVISAVLFLGYYSRKYQLRFDQKHLREVLHVKPLLQLSGLVAVLIVFQFGVIFLTMTIISEPDSEPPFNAQNIADTMIYLITAVIVAPVIEELLFRRGLYQSLKKLGKPMVANVIQALIFALLHGSIVALLSHFIAGMIFAYVYDRYKNIYAPIYLHGLHNLLSIILELLKL